MTLIAGKPSPRTVKATLDPRSWKELVCVLKTGDENERLHAALAMGAYPASATLLVEQLPRETAISVRRAILDTLMRLDAPAAIRGLTDYLRCEHVALRNEVIEVLRALGARGDRGSAMAPVLTTLLADPDPDLRIFAVNILESVRHPHVEQWLIDAIERDQQVNVCAAALDLLCKMGTEAATEPLLRLKARFPSEAYIQFAADLALQRIRES